MLQKRISSKLMWEINGEFYYLGNEQQFCDYFELYV